MKTSKAGTGMWRTGKEQNYVRINKIRQARTISRKEVRREGQVNKSMNESAKIRTRKISTGKEQSLVDR